MSGTSFDDWRRRLVQDRHWPILIAHGRANEGRGKFCGGAERGRVRARGVRSAGIARMDWRRACNGPGGHSGTCWLPARWNRKIGRAHVCTPVTNAHLVCRLLLEKKNMLHYNISAPTQMTTGLI